MNALSYALGIVLLAGATLPAATIVVPFTLSDSDPTYNRPLSFGQGGSPTLSLVGTAVHYTTSTFTPTSDTNVTVSIVDSDGASVNPTSADTFLTLYINSFNPASPLTNAVMANDDAVGIRSRMVTTTPLLAGTQYIVVLTSFDNTPSGGGAFPWTGQYVIFGDGINNGANIPEPSTLALGGLGLAGLVWLRRRR